MGTLEAIRSYTARAAAGQVDTRSDFDDLPASVYRPRVPRDMIREVEGATDLRDAAPRTGIPSAFASQVRTDGSGRIDTRPFQDEQGLPTERQRDFISSLLADLRALNEDMATSAYDYTRRMTENRAWDRSRGGNTSRWIDSLKTKIAELRTAPAATCPIVASVLPVKLDTNGKPMALRYAVEMDGTLKFYKIKQGNKPGFYFIDVQASDELHSIRNRASKDAIIAAIIAAGPDACMARYGREIGACGRCGRTLTDAESRARGIGPDCLGKM